jgi:hypothetical protein
MKIRSALTGVCSMFGLVTATANATTGLHCVSLEDPDGLALCDTNSFYRFAPGGGGWCELPGTETASYSYGSGLQNYGYGTTCTGAIRSTEAVCCNSQDGVSSQYFSTNSGTVTCGGSGRAVGGGVYCNNTSAKVVYSHPLPYTTGSTPTQWTGKCSSGDVFVYANCSYGSPDYYSDAVVIRTVSSSLTYATASCPAGRIALSAGVWCGSGYARRNTVAGDLLSTTAFCSANDTHAFAVCATGAYF